jgi:ribosomal protein L11 methyltransferase
MPDFLELTITANQQQRELAVALLADFGFDIFEEKDGQLVACGSIDSISTNDVEALFDEFPLLNGLPFSWREVEKENWNAQWESQFEPVLVDDRCYIYAPFHQIEKTYPLMLEIMPQMSFGTGHHPTTAGIISLMMREDWNGKRVLDAGTGTGILAIAARKLGAGSIFGYDIDPWSVENGKENALRNGITDFEIVLGGSETATGKFDVILANINRNVLIDQIPAYLNLLQSNGSIYFSGFYQHDWKELEKLLPDGKVEFQLNEPWLAVKFTL